MIMAINNSGSVKPLSFLYAVISALMSSPKVSRQAPEEYKNLIHEKLIRMKSKQYRPWPLTLSIELKPRLTLQIKTLPTPQATQEITN
jgi:hypothetical protein